ncbi:MAG: DUF6580 family putative transport protein [Candidatus Paceibacterota bacterium]
MEKYTKNWPKITLGILVCLLMRLIPFRPPNIEPILATQMPFSKAYGPLIGFFFAFLGILLYDFATATFGVWTFLTAFTYGALGVWAFYFFRKREPSRLDYARFAVLGTLFFDAVTGLSLGPIFYGQSFMEALVGQIPFTLWHLLGNVSFALILSPAIYKFIIKNEKLEHYSIVNLLRLKKTI